MKVFLLGATPAFTPAPDDTPETKLAKTGGNLGNQIIAHGLLSEIDHDAVSWDYRIGPQRVDEEYDLIAVAAANFLFPGFDLSGMADFIAATKLPCLMVGVGAQSSDFSLDLPLHPGTKRLMHVVSERSALIGVRGLYTADVLGAMGIKNVQVTGCPSYYLRCKPTLEIAKPGLGDRPRVAINGSRDVIRHSFGAEKMQQLLRELMQAAVADGFDFVAQTEINEIKFAESDGHGDEYFRHFEAFFKGVAAEPALRTWLRSHVRAFWDVAAWLAAMPSYDYVLGTRFHGAIAAIETGVPATVICHDTRTTEMCQFLGIPHVGMMDLDTVDLAGLYQAADLDKLTARYAELYPAYRSFMEANAIPHLL